jgi:hypothetical protein
MTRGTEPMADPESIARIMSVVGTRHGNDPSPTAYEGALDDLVHDLKSEEASEINNNGPEAQVEFLLDAGMTEDEILHWWHGD